MTDSSQMIPPHESDASEAVNRSPSSRSGSQRGAAATNGYRRRAERNSRGGFNQQHHRSNYYPTPLVGPHTEFYTPPRAVFDLPPQFLPPHMFNANVVPVSERDANFELQFGNYSRNVPYINNDGLFIPPQQQLQPQEFIPSEQQPEEVYANGLESQLGQLFIPTQQQRQPQEFIPSEQPSQEVYTNGLESQLEQLNVGGNEGHQLVTTLDVPSRHRQKSPRSTDRSKNASHSNATQSNRRHVNAQNRKSRGGSGSSSFKRGNQRGRGAAVMERQMQRPAAYNDLESFPLADSSGIPAEEGYGCPPSYLLETYRDETDRQQMAAAAAAASALLPSRGRRNGTQIFPGRRRGHSNQPNNQFSGMYQVSNEQIQRRNERKDDDGNLDTLRDRLKKQLEDNTYECMICCQTIQANQWIWTCSKCFHMFHMNRANTYGCITQWAAKSFDPDLGWRCPSCQNLSFELPKQYRCFCGKRLNPATQRFPDMPHSCNAICGKSRGFGCPHKCSEQCHPGPCPECPAMVTRSCNCGAETKAIRCGTTPEFQCSKVCDKILNCGVHKCAKVCHKGGCGVCEEVIVQTCYCGLDERTVPCTALNLQSESYSCGAPCDGMYSCGIHKCDMRCHLKKDEDGSCGACSLSPEKKEYCPCGRVKIVDLIDKPREKCTDPIPTCDNICGKVLLCGSKDKPHRCKQKCHTGPCPPCPDNSSIVCRCKSLKKTIPCKEFLRYSDSNPFTCERRCRKLKSCQNHRCQAMCCVDTEHFCMQICNKKLDCGNHNCDRLCHVGQCPRCLQASFEEQYCLCGHTVREPPIPCGTPLPPCDQPCSRQHACEHPPMHNCHSEPECPPCTVLTQKECYGGHEIRSNIPCYLNDVSCGRPCDKALPCGVHTCKRICHPGECLTAENPVCKQPCTIPREGQACDHACGLPCHGKEPCPKSVCTEKIMVTCGCQRKTAEMRCVDVERAYQKMMAVRVSEASEESDSSQKRILKRSPSLDKYRCLPCDSDCRRIMRNKKVASALSIATDSEANNLSVLDGTVSSVPTYTDFLKAQLQKSFKHVLEVENALVDLVHAVELHETGATRTHIFRPMTSENRRLIHEYACYFRVETVSYDAEPKRNVVATAKCGSSCVPCVLLTMLNNPNGSALGHIVNLPSLNSQNQSVASSSSVPSVGKDFSWTTNTSGMQQLQPVGKVVKRGFSEAAQNTSK